MAFGWFKENIEGLLSLSVLMQLFMNALAKSHTKILHISPPQFCLGREKNDIKVRGSELEGLSQPELYILWSLQASCLLIKKAAKEREIVWETDENKLAFLAFWFYDKYGFETQDR